MLALAEPGIGSCAQAWHQRMPAQWGKAVPTHHIYAEGVQGRALPASMTQVYGRALPVVTSPVPTEGV